MLNFVEVIVVFVVIVGAFIVVEAVLQFCFHAAVGGFGGKHIRVFQWVG